MSSNCGRNSLEVLQDEIRNCRLCSLCETMPFKPVPGVGPLKADIFVVGEAPGEDESILEEPFVGLAGKMLDKLLVEAGIDRSSIYISNVVNCRPTEGKRNRPPTRTEIKTCQGWLVKQILEVQPKLIFTLGKIPTCTVLGLKTAIKLHDYIGTKQNLHIKGTFENINIAVIPNLHPSYVMVYGKKEVQTAVRIFREGLEYVKTL